MPLSYGRYATQHMADASVCWGDINKIRPQGCIPRSMSEITLDRGEDGVTKSDFTAWWGDDRAAGTGYSKPGSFWEAFAKAAMNKSEQFHKPNTRTYRWVGEE